jgi:hypothetical protein
MRTLYGTHPLCIAAADEIDLLVETLAESQKHLRNWRDEVGKLHSQIDRLKADLRSWEITAKRIEEADGLASDCCDLAANTPSHGCPAVAAPLEHPLSASMARTQETMKRLSKSSSE